MYSLGATLYAALVGRPPFQAANVMDTLQQVIFSPPVAPRALNPAVPRDLETMCLKCLEKERGKRYATAAELGEDLQRWRDGKPIHARPVGPAERFWRWCRRQPAIAGLTAAVLVTLVAGALISSMFAVKANKERDRANANAKRADQKADEAGRNAATATQKAKEAEEQKNRAEMQLLRARTAEYSIKIGLAQRDLLEGNIVDAEELLEGCAPDLRGWEHRYLWTTIRKRRMVHQGHTGKVTRAAFSPHGDRIASGSWDNTVKLWDVATRQETLTLKGHTQHVNSVAFSADGQRIVSGSDDKTVKLWDAATGVEILTLKGHTDAVRSVAFTPDGKQILSWSGDMSWRGGMLWSRDMLCAWDKATGKETLAVTLKGRHTAAAFSADGKWIAAGSYDGMVKVWDVAAYKEKLTLNTFEAKKSDTSASRKDIRLMAFSPDGKQIVSGSDDGAVDVWDAATGKWTFGNQIRDDPAYSIAFSPDARLIAWGSNFGLVHVLDVTTRKQRTFGHWTNNARVRSLVFSLDGQRIVSAGGGGNGHEPGEINVWDVATGKETLTLKGHTASVVSVAFSPDGARVASTSTDMTLKVWDVATGRDPLRLDGWARLDRSVAFSPNGKRVALCTNGAGVKVWDAATGRELLWLKGPDALSVAFSPDGERIASGGFQKTVKVWDAATGQEKLTLKAQQDWVCTVAFSPDGRQIVSGSFYPGGSPNVPSDTAVNIWDVATGKETLSLPFKGHTNLLSSIAFSTDGKRIASGGHDKTVKVWDAVTHNESLTLEGHNDFVTSVAFSADRRRIVSGSWDKTAKVWDTATGQEILALKGHTDGVNCVAFSPDGRRIVSGCWDKTVKIWDTATGQEILTLKGHTDDVNCVAFSPDGERIASGSQEDGALIWDAATGKQTSDSAQRDSPLIRAQPPQIELNDATPHAPQTPADVASLRKRLPTARKLASDGGNARWSTDGQRMAFNQMPFGWAVGIVNVETLAVSTLIAPGKDPAWSPRNANMIVFVRGLEADDEEIWITDVSGRNPKWITRGHWPVWAMDGKSLYFHSRKLEKIFQISVDPPGKPVELCDMPYTLYPCITADGKRMACFDEEELVVLDIPTRKPLAKRHLGKWDGFLAGWSPDGKLLGYGAYGMDNTVGLWMMNVATGQVVQVAEGPFTAPTWSPDGSKLAFDRRANGGIEIWMIETKDLEKLWDAK